MKVRLGEWWRLRLKVLSFIIITWGLSTLSCLVSSSSANAKPSQTCEMFPAPLNQSAPCPLSVSIFFGFWFWRHGLWLSLSLVLFLSVSEAIVFMHFNGLKSQIEFSCNSYNDRSYGISVLSVMWFRYPLKHFCEPPRTPSCWGV